MNTHEVAHEDVGHADDEQRSDPHGIEQQKLDQHQGNRPRIVVGIDDTDHSAEAVRWAVEAARLAQLPLHAVYAYSWPRLMFSSPRVPLIPQSAWLERRDYAQQRIDELVAHVRQAAPTVAISGAALAGEPVSVLAQAAAGASMLVVGSRQLSTASAYLLGSVSRSLVGLGNCPVVVVRGDQAGNVGPARIVVGLGLEESADPLLEFAFAEADRRTVPLDAITCWHVNRMASSSLLIGAADRARSAVAEHLSATLEPWRQKFPHLEVTESVEECEPTVELVDRAPGNLLVIGSHGHHPLTGALLGSVSLAVLHHAHSPVVVVATSRRHEPTMEAGRS